ncbi:hypothetical protein M407DRAFT_246187 [Tulasnella calospora MUT 4182]|uniref:Elongator complex protein 5 n=1 Tax=Tulasnella calospora MUT 4182 TaxID=1051891 RepID=A0A0C3KD86_9AGAM|nr:hypothetical protein M407DRAFT_246187 [Tulasnella calospora MUT 4182]
MVGQRGKETQLSTVLSNHGVPKSRSPLVIVQYDASVTPWPIVRHLLWNEAHEGHIICLTYNFTPAELAGPRSISQRTTMLDWTGYIPGYEDETTAGNSNPQQPMLDAIEKNLEQPLTILIDSIDTFRSDIESTSSTCLFVGEILEALSKSQHPTSRLVLPIPSQSLLLPHLTSTSISQNLTLLVLHSPYLVAHLSQSYLTSPPLDSAHPSDKFWSLFLPAAQRGEGEKLVLSGEGGAYRKMHEGIVEVVIRGGRKGVERTLEGWRVKDAGEANQKIEACLCGDLEVIKVAVVRAGASVARSSEATAEADVTHGLSFNLGLTSSQAEAKSKVALPYTMAAQQASSTAAVIHYDPDSADDMDDEDPDEDLDL